MNTATAIPYQLTTEMDRETWLEERKKGIGGSDAPKILGVSDYGTAVDVWLDKTGQMPDTPDNDLMWFGRHVEPLIATRFEEETGMKVQNDHKMRFHKDHPYIMANMDRLILSDGNGRGTGILECKSTSYYAAKKWGEMDINPSWYVQVQHYMLVTGYEYAFIAYLVDRTYHHHQIEADSELHNLMLEKYEEFWAHVEAGTPPPVSSGDDVDKLFPSEIPGKSIEADETIIEAHRELIDVKEQIKRLDDKKKELEGQVKTAISDAESLVYGNQVLATYKQVSGSRLDSKKLKKEHPELVDQFSKPYSYRRLNLKS